MSGVVVNVLDCNILNSHSEYAISYSLVILTPNTLFRILWLFNAKDSHVQKKSKVGLPLGKG